MKKTLSLRKTVSFILYILGFSIYGIHGANQKSDLIKLIDNCIDKLETLTRDVDNNENSKDIDDSDKSNYQVVDNDDSKVSDAIEEKSDENPLKTERYYYRDSYQNVLDTKIILFGKDDEGVYFVPRSTIFHPQGGGQPADKGCATIANNDYDVIKLVEHEDIIKHYINTPNLLNQKNATVKMKIDLDSRKYFARIHSAGHLIANILESKYNFISGTKGNHFPNSSAVVFTRNDKGDNHKVAKQDFVDMMITNKKNKKINNYNNVKEYLQKDLDNRIAIGGKVIVKNDSDTRRVSMGNLKSYPCGGTHVQDINEIGSITINYVKFKKNEGLKVSYTM